MKSATVKFLDKVLGEPMTLGRMLVSIGKEEGLSVAQLAKKLGVSRQHLHAIENELTSVSIARAVRWAKVLGYPEALFVELALQSEVAAAGMRLRVKVEAA